MPRHARTTLVLRTLCTTALAAAAGWSPVLAARAGLEAVVTGNVVEGHAVVSTRLAKDSTSRSLDRGRLGQLKAGEMLYLGDLDLKASKGAKLGGEA